MRSNDKPMTLRIVFGLPLLVASYFGLFASTLYIKVPIVLVFCLFLALLCGLVALSLAQDDGAARKEVDPEQVAEIRTEARKRCLEEVVALIRGKDIEYGIGVDVPLAYYSAVSSSEREFIHE